MNPESLRYGLKLFWDGRSGGKVNFKDHPTLKFDMPKAFGGDGGYPCPDELFLSAIGGCLMTTFLYFQRKTGFKLKSLHVLINGSVKLVGPQGYRITGLKAMMHIETVKDEEEKAKECFELAKNFCHITRTLEGSIPTEVTAEIVFTR